VAHVVTAAGQVGDDAQPQRVGQRREHRDELVAGWLISSQEFSSCVRLY
jgi:hypothetical protein